LAKRVHGKTRAVNDLTRMTGDRASQRRFVATGSAGLATAGPSLPLMRLGLGPSARVSMVPSSGTVPQPVERAMQTQSIVMLHRCSRKRTVILNGDIGFEVPRRLLWRKWSGGESFPTIRSSAERGHRKESITLCAGGFNDHVETKRVLLFLAELQFIRSEEAWRRRFPPFIVLPGRASGLGPGLIVQRLASTRPKKSLSLRNDLKMTRLERASLPEISSRLIGGESSSLVWLRRGQAVLGRVGSLPFGRERLEFGFERLGVGVCFCKRCLHLGQCFLSGCSVGG
jgi:hypothetical protein